MNRVTSLLKSVPFFSHSKHPLVFDMGSTETRVLYQGEVLVQEATCIAIHRHTNSVVAVGAKAVSLLGKVSNKFDVVFPVQEGAIVSAYLCQTFIEALLKNGVTSSFSRFFGFSAVVVVPTNLSPVQITVYKEVFSQAGFRSVTLVPQAQALLTSLGGDGQQESFCYFDLGGQKSECSIFTLDENIESRQFRIGGVNFTEIIQREVRLQHNLEISWHVAEQLKHESCSVTSFVPGGKRVAAIKMSVRGKDVVTQAGKTVVVSSSDFTEPFSVVVEELLEELQFFFSVVPAHLVAATLESGLYITGGLSAMAGMRELIESTFSAPVRVSSQPRLDASKGVAQKIYIHE